MVVPVLTPASPGSDSGPVIGRNKVFKEHVLHRKFLEQTFFKRVFYCFVVTSKSGRIGRQYY